MNQKKKLIRKGGLLVFALLLATFLSFAVQPSKVSAATKKIKKQTSTTSREIADKKATVVKKGTVTLKFTQGYAKFKAPKTANYTFTFSNLKQDSASPLIGIKISTPDRYNKPKMKTQGGYSDTLYISNKDVESYYATQTTYSLLKRPLTKRSVKFKIYKNEEVYFFFVASRSASSKIKLNIK